MKLCSQSEGTLSSRMIAAARSRIMEVPMSPAACIISTTMPDGPSALPAFICEIAFITISVVIGMGGMIFAFCVNDVNGHKPHFL